MARLSFDRFLTAEGKTDRDVSECAPPVRLRSVEDAVRNLPPLPSMMTELLREMGNVDADIRMLEERIARDPALTTRLLRMANSAFYSPAARVCSVGQALMTLGLRSARNLVVATAMRAVMGSRRQSRSHGAGLIFQHAVASAVAATRIVKSAPTFDDISESAFVAGLLHDVGMVALADLYAELGIGAEPGHSLDPATERRALGVDHLEVGAMVHAHWRLPPDLLAPITRHHDAPDLLTGERLTATVALAETFADAEGFSADQGESDALEQRPRQEALAEILGLSIGGVSRSMVDLAAEVRTLLGTLR